MNLRTTCCMLLLLLSLGAAVGQTNRSLSVRPMVTNTVDAITNLSIVDGRLFFYSSDMLFSAPLHPDGIGACDVDLSYVGIDPQMCYLTRHPVSGHIFFNRRDTKGRSLLFEYDDTSRFWQIKFPKFNYSVSHPVFSKDGTVMVFSSDAPRGYGGLDLWYCMLEDGQWSAPVNMGPNINTEGDECSPCISGEYLFFTTDGRNDLSQYAPSVQFDVYATRLISTHRQFGDTVVDFPIGRALVQRVYDPVSTSLQEPDFVMDVQGGRGFWATRRDEVGGRDRLFQFLGRLDCAMVSGRVLAAVDKNALSTIQVSLDGEELFAVESGANGAYQMLLQPDRVYTLSVSHENCFSSSFQVDTHREPSDSLYAEQYYDVFLGSFMMGHVYVYDNHDANAAFFAAEASDNLSAKGRELLDQMASFMAENPRMALEVTAVVVPPTTDDSVYCQLFAAQRLEAVRSYLKSRRLTDKQLDNCRFVPSLEPYSENPDNESAPMFDNAFVVRMFEKY